MALLDLRFASAALIRSILTGMYLALGACTKVAVAGRSNVYSPTGGRGQTPTRATDLGVTQAPFCATSASSSSRATWTNRQPAAYDSPSRSASLAGLGLRVKRHSGSKACSGAVRGITDNASVATGEVKETTAVRILQVIQELSTGGAESIVRRLIATAVEMGDDAAVACAGDPHVPSGVECFSLPILRRRPTLVPDASRRLRRAIDAFKPDVVHCHNPGMAVITAVATRRGRIVPAAVTVHGMPPSDERRAARLLRLAGLPVVACGPGVAASLASHRIDVLCTIVNGVVP